MRVNIGISKLFLVADLGFPFGGGGVEPPMRALFGENVCKNERIGSRRGSVSRARPLDPANDFHFV